MLALVAFIWTFLSGSGGYSIQELDYFGHNAKFYDLYSTKWPYYFTETNRLIRYYFSYYLVPSLLFKLLGGTSPATIFLWTFTGYFLGIAWVYTLVQKNLVLVIVFLLIGGGGTTLFNLVSRFVAFAPQLHTFNINLGSLFDQSRWTPNQVIPSLIGACIIVYDSALARKTQESFFPIALTVTWSMFSFLSLSVIFGIHALFYINPLRLSLATIVRAFLLPLLVLLPILLYFASGENVPTTGFVWQFRNDTTFIIRYLTGVFLDSLLLYYIFRQLYRPGGVYPRRLVTILFVVFICMTTYIMGKWNDWLTKINIPFLTIFLVIIFRAFYEKLHYEGWRSLRPALTVPLAVFFFLNLYYQVLIIRTPLKKNKLLGYVTESAKYKPIPYNKYGSFYKTLLAIGTYEEVRQYLAKKNSFYELYLAKRRPANP
ncbi:hypothetical protein GCM10023187_02430 [Nibrella viscosa]|uniref:EpsG family protein n=2 Tax=Nibrella viscosa TaxID=1084524 RepID=A0ABP8JSS2_9BACT